MKAKKNRKKEAALAGSPKLNQTAAAAAAADYSRSTKNPLFSPSNEKRMTLIFFSLLLLSLSFLRPEFELASYTFKPASHSITHCLAGRSKASSPPRTGRRNWGGSVEQFEVVSYCPGIYIAKERHHHTISTTNLNRALRTYAIESQADRHNLPILLPQS